MGRVLTLFAFLAFFVSCNTGDLGLEPSPKNEPVAESWNWASFKNILDDYIGQPFLSQSQYNNFVSYWNPY